MIITKQTKGSRRLREPGQVVGGNTYIHRFRLRHSVTVSVFHGRWLVYVHVEPPARHQWRYRACWDELINAWSGVYDNEFQIHLRLIFVSFMYKWKLERKPHKKQAGRKEVSECS